MITPEGDYLSNLQAPDLRGFFKHLTWRVMPHSMGHLVASDWADKADDDPVFGLYKKCGLWTRDEAAILYECARATVGDWLDIGSHTGWTSAHIGAAIGPGDDGDVICVDPMLRNEEFRARCLDALNAVDAGGGVDGMTSLEFFALGDDVGTYMGVVIDGDHEPGKPLEDAQNVYKHLADTGVILLHDGLGAPVREAVTWLMDQGFKARCYWTPHLVFCCWRGDFTTPEHEPDKRIDWAPHLLEMSKDFDFGRLD